MNSLILRLISLLILPVRIPVGTLFGLFKFRVLSPIIYCFAVLDMKIYESSLSSSLTQYLEAKSLNQKELEVGAERRFIRTHSKMLRSLEEYWRDGIRVQQPKEVSAMAKSFL